MGNYRVFAEDVMPWAKKSQTTIRASRRNPAKQSEALPKNVAARSWAVSDGGLQVRSKIRRSLRASAGAALF
jgi:hypothetical protein